MAPAMNPEVDLHYTCISGSSLSSKWQNGEKHNLGINTFHLHLQGFVVFLHSAQGSACSVIGAHLKE